MATRSLVTTALLTLGVAISGTWSSPALAMTVSCSAAETSDPDTITAMVGRPTSFTSCFCTGTTLFGNSGAFGNFQIKANASICSASSAASNDEDDDENNLQTLLDATGRDNDAAAYDIFTSRGGTQPTPASEYQPGGQETTGGGGDDEDEEDGGGGERTELVPVPPQIRPLSPEELAAIERFEGEIAGALEAVRAAQLQLGRLRDKARLLNLFRTAAATDIKNDLTNILIGEAVDVVTGRLEGFGDGLPDDQQDAFKELVGEAVGLTGEQLEQETPDELAELLSSKLGEDDADAIAEAAINILTLGGTLDEDKLPGIAKLASKLFDFSKIGAKLLINEIEFDVLFQDFQRERQATADQAAIAVARALSTVDGRGREFELFQAAQSRRNEFERFVASNDTRTTADGTRHNEVAQAFQQAFGLASQLANEVGKTVEGGNSVALAAGQTRGSETLAQFISLGVRTGEVLPSTFSAVIEVSNLENRPAAINNFLTQSAAELDVANPAVPGMSIVDFIEVKVNNQLVAPEQVAAVQNLRWYLDANGGLVSDNRGTANSNSRNFAFATGADSRVTKNIVAGAAIRYTRNEEDDDAANADIDSWQLSLTPYATYEFQEGFYADGYLLLAFGRREATNLAGQSDTGNTRSVGLGLGLNFDAPIARDWKATLRGGADWAVVDSDELSPGGTRVRGNSTSSSGSLSLRSKLTWSQPWGSLAGEVTAVQAIGSDAPSSVDKLTVTPGLEAIRRLESVPGAELQFRLSGDLLQDDFDSIGGAVRFQLSF